MSEFQDLAVNLAIAPNLLRDKENMLSLLQIASNSTVNGKKLTECDLVFDTVSETKGLNEKTISKLVVIPRERILDQSKSA